MTSRWVALLVLGAVIGGGLALDQVHDRDESTTVLTDSAAALVTDGFALSTAWYCAAGEIGEETREHRVVITNLGSEPASATVSVHGERGEPVVTDLDVAANQSRVVPLSDIGQPGAAAALVEVPGDRILVEHRLGTGAAAPCASVTSDEWYVAWGSTRKDATETLYVFNPQSDEAVVDITFETEEGDRDPADFEGFVVPGRSVRAIEINQAVNRRNLVGATVLARTGRVVVERLVEFDGSEGVAGSAVSLATPAPQTEWLFADGGSAIPTGVTDETAATTTTVEGEDVVEEPPAEAAIEERIVVLNPSDEPAELIIDVQTPGVEPFERSVRADSVVEIETTGSTRVPFDVTYGISVVSDNGVPIVVERVRTATDGAGIEVSTGVPSARARFAGGPVVEGPSEIVIFNPNSDSLSRVELTRPDGTPIETIEVDPNGQARVPVARGGVVLEASFPVVAERMMADGTSVLSVPLSGVEGIE